VCLWQAERGWKAELVFLTNYFPLILFLLLVCSIIILNFILFSGYSILHLILIFFFFFFYCPFFFVICSNFTVSAIILLNRERPLCSSVVSYSLSFFSYTCSWQHPDIFHFFGSLYENIREGKSGLVRSGPRFTRGKAISGKLHFMRSNCSLFSGSMFMI
jgi:hypothetical protein